MSKKLIFLSIVCLALIKPENCSATVIPGFAIITKTGFSSSTLRCGSFSKTCCTVVGNVITINHWSGEIIGNLLGELPSTIQNNFPIPFTTEDEIQHD